jgi:gamma-glutamyltranspeptidase/glutathione hydrolase
MAGPRGGAIACGHSATAAAAAEILEDGGNAFDAALAAFAAASVAEPVLCSLAGGGFLMAQPRGETAILYDFFVDTPRQTRPAGEIDFYPVDADFGTATQEFHIGVGSIATPGAVAGLTTVHADLGALPLARLLEPATALAREGVALRPQEAYISQVVSPILLATPEARQLNTNAAGELLRAGERRAQPELAATFEWLAAEGAEPFYHGELAARLVAFCRDNGGLLTAADLAGYRVARRAPLTCRHRELELVTNPPPSTGGILIAFALALLSEETPAERLSPEHLVRLARVMEETNKARVDSGLARAGGPEAEASAAQRLLDPAFAARYRREVLGRPSCSRGTTHISVIDSAGNAASLTLSNGEGCGHLLPKSGIMLNNMLGEEDLNPRGFHAWTPGSRLGSMMAPSLLHLRDGGLAALGSGGSNRIRTAVLQVLLNMGDFDLPVEAAVTAPRLHVERGVANLEEGHDEPVAAALAELDEVDKIHHWPYGNLFFGGVHAVVRDRDARLSAAGDPRRGGVAKIV